MAYFDKPNLPSTVGYDGTIFFRAPLFFDCILFFGPYYITDSNIGSFVTVTFLRYGVPKSATLTSQAIFYILVKMALFEKYKYFSPFVASRKLKFVSLINLTSRILIKTSKI